MQDKQLREATSQWVAALEVLSSEMPANESRSVIREVFSAFLLLRWADLQDAEQEAMAVFEDRIYLPLLPEPLQWRHWVHLDPPSAIVTRLQALAQHVEGLRADAAHPVAAYLHALAEPLRLVLKVNFFYLHDFVRWVADLPFETPSERRALLDLFDQAIAETSDPYDGQYATPVNIARLVAALASPQPGERVYDPCFGSGNFLVAGWQQAESSRNELRRPGALLEVAGIEINASAFLIGLTRMLLAGIEAPRLELGNSLERESLSSPSRQGFDVVLANPPIGAKSSREPWRYQHFPIATNDSTGLFVQHALSQLKPHGRAVIAVPEGFLFRGGAERELRRHLLEQGQVEAVIGLPAGSFAPYTRVKGSLLMLSKQGGCNRVRMVDATPFFETRLGRKPFISEVQAQHLAEELRRPDLRKPTRSLETDTLDRGMLSSPMWEMSVEELASTEWDLTPRRREKGGLVDLLSSLKESLRESLEIVPLSTVAVVSTGRAIKSADLVDEPQGEAPVGYIRIKDLVKGKVGRCSSWLAANQADIERRWALLSGDVLVSKSGAIGKAALVSNGAVGSVAANGFYVLRVNRQQLDPSFLLAYLASSACQNWLVAQSRGTMIQHLNRDVLDSFPIPLPPLRMQAAVAASHRIRGTDALASLAQDYVVSESDRLKTWLAELSATVPNFSKGLDATPSLSLLEPLVSMARTAQGWVHQDFLGGNQLRCLLPLIDALLLLDGIDQIPLGPSKLTVLERAENSLQVVLEQANAPLPTEEQVRSITLRLWSWLDAAKSDLTERCEIGLLTTVSELAAGSFAEFTVEVTNKGNMPIRTLHIGTLPDWGVLQSSYLSERGTVMMNLRGDVPKSPGTLDLMLTWTARSLMGEDLSGTVGLALQIVEPTHGSATPVAELGGSPYVTGSPLEPLHGHSVFFGRKGLIEQISRQIATHGNVVLLEGNRRAGKTSILKHLEGSSTVSGWLAVYASLQGAEGATQAVGVPTKEIFREIARSIATALSKLDINVPLPNGNVIPAGRAALGVARACREGINSESPFADFREYLELILSVLKPMDLGVLLMLDEFDKLQEGIDNGVTSPQVPENIRFLIQNYPKFSAILTGSRRLKRLREEYWSALYGLGTSISVTALDVPSARSVVTEPVRGKLTYSNEAIEHVVDITARQPYLLQCLCNRVFDFAVLTNTRSITLGAVNEVATSLVRDNEHFASLWDYAGQGSKTGRYRRQLILLLCARSFKQSMHISFGALQEQLLQLGVDVGDEVLATDLVYLRELELIDLTGKIGDGHYRLAIPLMADWVEQQQDADVLSSRARIEAEEDNG